MQAARLDYRFAEGTVDLAEATLIPLSALRAGRGPGGLTPNNVVFCGPASGVDDTTLVNDAIAQAMSTDAGGEVVLWDTNNDYICLGALDIPNDGKAALPRQNPLRIRGLASAQYGYWTGPGVPHGAPVLDLRFAGDGGTHVAKIDTRGAGFLEIDHLVLKSGGTDNFPFVQTTNTTILGHHNAFLGNRANSGQNSLQDAWILGGTGATSQDLGSNSFFQGYGTHLHDNFYDQIRHVVTFGAQANGVVVSDETVSKTCGSGTNPDAPFFFSGSGAGGGAAGVKIRGGVVEITNYTYGIVLDHSTGCRFDEVQYYDDLAYTLAQVYADVNSTANLVICAWGDLPFAAGPGAGDVTYLTSRHLNRSNFVRGLIVGNQDGKGLDVPLIRMGPNSTLQTPNDTTPTGGNLTIDTGSGGSHLDTKSFDVRHFDPGGANQVVISPANGVGRLFVAGNSVAGLSIRDGANGRDNLQIYNSGQVAAFFQLYPGAEAGGQNVSGGYLHSTGVPTNANGNNNDFCISDNNNIYVRVSGVWSPVAWPSNTQQAQPTNPTGTASTTGVMMGLAVAFTPKATGKVKIVISGDIFNATAIADGGSVQIRHGTGTAPANAAALTGTADGGQPSYIAATTAEKAPFSLNAIVSGLSVGVAIWVDLALAAITGGTATVENLSVSIEEV